MGSRARQVETAKDLARIIEDTAEEDRMSCAHNDRAQGEVFDRCLLCKRWRMIGHKTWWSQKSKPMPIAPHEKAEMQDFKEWLDEEAA